MAVEVSVTDYRANLRRWHERVQQGEVVVVTENGSPTVRVTAASAESLFERWEREGRITRPTGPRPKSWELPPPVEAEGWDSQAYFEGEGRR